MKNYVFTSESVSEGHPDKIADQISDAVLDAALTDDKNARVACEVLVSSRQLKANMQGVVMITGEISTVAQLDIEEIARNTIRSIGYNDLELGFDSQSCAVTTAISYQSLDIEKGIHQKKLGAGDQGIMFGYACNETPELMPAPILYAHRLVKRQAELRKTGELPWLRPDAKSQVSLTYKEGIPNSVMNVVLSTQHDATIRPHTLQEAVLEHIIKPVFPKEWITHNTRFLVNPAGRFVIGGPVADTGLTGRKIIVDTYGGMARHGGGCFSGKDPSKVDRSAAYIARKIAKNIVAADLADRCEVQLAYAIGISEPTAIYINTFETGKVPEARLIQTVKQCFDLSVEGIIHELDLLRPIYQQTAAYGHFGRLEPAFSWEMTDKVALLHNKI